MASDVVLCDLLSFVYMQTHSLPPLELPKNTASGHYFSRCSTVRKSHSGITSFSGPDHDTILPCFHLEDAVASTANASTVEPVHIGDFHGQRAASKHEEKFCISYHYIGNVFDWLCLRLGGWFELDAAGSRRVIRPYLFMKCHSGSEADPLYDIVDYIKRRAV